VPQGVRVRIPPCPKNHGGFYPVLASIVRGESLPAGRQALPGTTMNDKIKVLYQDDDLIALNKPAGLAVHGGVGIKENTLVDYLLKIFPEIKNVGDDPELRPGIVHRLDKDTSGVMVIARNQESFDHLKGLFKNRKVEKKYIALVFGTLKNKEGKIEGEMGRSKSDFRKQSLVRGKIGVRHERYSLTYYKVISEFKDTSLLEVSPRTGRMHQIRVHLQAIGHPIVGDKKYTFKNYKRIACPRMFLHSKSISFLGMNGKKNEFTADLPGEFELFANTYPNT
jgi:23S rRNA pseudouridine1911/1915/1917 synthase